MFIVILVISNASLLALAAVILRSEFGILNLCMLHSDIHFFFFLYLQFAYGFKYNFILVFFFVLLPLFDFFPLYQIALYFISHFILSLIGMS